MYTDNFKIVTSHSTLYSIRNRCRKMSEGPTSLQEFVNHSTWPYVVFYLMYAALKYTGLVLALCILVCKRKRQRKIGDANVTRSRSENSVIKYIISHASKFVHLTIGVLPNKLTMS